MSNFLSDESMDCTICDLMDSPISFCELVAVAFSMWVATAVTLSTILHSTARRSFMAATLSGQAYKRLDNGLPR